MYKIYRVARDKSWEVLIESNISYLPLNLKEILNTYKLDMKFFESDKDAFIKNNVIYINRSLNKTRARFTLAHELGHILLNHKELKHANHEFENPTKLEEYQANIFARDLLMPAIVLKELDCIETEKIMELCLVSRQSAQYRSKRLKELLKRNKFYVHPLERQVLNNFKDFINYKKSFL